MSTGVNPEKVVEDITEILNNIEIIIEYKNDVDKYYEELVSVCNALNNYAGKKISDSYHTYEDYDNSSDQWYIVTKCNVCNTNPAVEKIINDVNNVQMYLNEIPSVISSIITEVETDKNIISYIEEKINDIKNVLGEVEYSVQSGDTLIKIAALYGIDYIELANYNNIDNPNNINVNQKIKIPFQTKELENKESDTKNVPTEEEYLVKSGDTLIKIAALYGLDYIELAKHNNISDPSKINVNQKIKIPVTTVAESDVLSDSTENIEKTEKKENKLLNWVKSLFTSSDTKKVDPNSNVGQAIQKYGTEFDDDTEVIVKDNIYMTIKKETVDGNECYVTHVVINDASQINGEPANGEYASGLETTSSAADRLGATLAINGSHFDYADGSEDLKGANHVVIVDSQIKTDGTAGGMEICIDNNGKLFTPKPGTSAQELVDMGVKYTFSSHDSHLIENGNITYEHQDSSYNSTVIGMVKPCEYYIVTGSTTNVGVSEFLYDKGCTFAKSMDQGGSVSLVKEGELVNNPTDGTERAVGDFLYFT